MKNTSALFLLLLLTTTFSGCSVSSVDDLKVDYLAVKNEKGEYWNIVDSKGNFIVKEEYPEDNEISAILNDVYWVKNADGYSLYNLNDPKKSVIDKTYEKATLFTNGIASVSNPDENILLIADDGSEVAKMPDNVYCVYRFSKDGLAIYGDAKKKALGYINTDGDVVLEAKYGIAFGFNEGLALVVNKADGEKEYPDIKIIEKDGTEIGSISTKKYSLPSFGFSDGLLSVVNKSTNKIEYLDKKGKIVLIVEKSQVPERSDYAMTYAFRDGYAPFINKDKLCGLINKKGEVVIRPKYEVIIPRGETLFAAVKDGKWGIIDAEDNTIVDFDYDNVSLFKLGDNFLAQDKEYWHAINSEGKRAFYDEFERFSSTNAEHYSEFINVKGIINDLVGMINADNFDGIYPGTTAAELAKVFGFKSAKDYYGKNFEAIVNLESSSSVEPKIVYRFYDKAVEQKTHVERVSDGWWTYDKTVVDGYAFTDTKIVGVDIEIDLGDTGISSDVLSEKVCDALKNKGFVVDESMENADDTYFSIVCKGCVSNDKSANEISVVVRKMNNRVSITYVYPLAAAFGEYNGKTGYLGKLKTTDNSKTDNETVNEETVNSSGNPYSWLSDRLVTEADIKEKTSAEIRLMRNAIFAMHGYIFKDKKLTEHFSQFNWYKAERNDVSGLLNEIENKNIAFLKSHE